MSNVDRAAEVIVREAGVAGWDWHHQIAQALADAGLLVPEGDVLILRGVAIGVQEADWQDFDEDYETWTVYTDRREADDAH